LPQALKLLLDENIGIIVYRELKKRGLDVQSIMLECRGADDVEVVRIAKSHNKVIVTMDKDFGYLALSYNPPGVVLLRLKDPRIPKRLKAILKAIELKEKLYGYITIVAETVIKRRPINP